MASDTYTLYSMQSSGNCYKPRLLAEQLGIDYTWQEVDLLKGESNTPEFLAMNPNGAVPVLTLSDGECLPESNAILCYLADGTPLWPSERLARAQVLRWLFFEQYILTPFIQEAATH